MSEKIVFHCECGQKLNVGDDKAGQLFACPTCGDQLRVPPISEPPTLDTTRDEEESSLFHSRLSLPTPPKNESSTRGGSIWLRLIWMFFLLWVITEASSFDIGNPYRYETVYQQMVGALSHIATLFAGFLIAFGIASTVKG